MNVERSTNMTGWTVIAEGNTIGTFTESAGNFTKAFYRLGKMVFVEGNATVASFLISNTETTWGEWKRVRSWAITRGYDLATAGAAAGNADLQPVQSVNWFEAIKWCNARSEMEGLAPVYTVNGTIYRSGTATPLRNGTANGYRLPTETEWARAARGGIRSQGYIYSGSNSAGLVAWYNENSSGAPKPVGTKAANELGIFDMSGNVFEWCWDAELLSQGANRGGSWATGAEQCEVAKSYEDFPNVRATDLGFRVVRNAP